MSLIPSGLIQVSLWFQMLFFMFLYDKPIHLTRSHEKLFYMFGVWGAAWIYRTGFSVGYFTTLILSQYILMILLATWVFNNKYEFREAVCLGFLVVFLNSFYWEFFYHVYEFQIWLPYSLGFTWWYVRLPQWIRILPAFWVVRKFRVVDTRYVSYGLVISFFLTLLRFTVFASNRFTLLLVLHRIISLIILIKTIYDAEPRI